MANHGNGFGRFSRPWAAIAVAVLGVSLTACAPKEAASNNSGTSVSAVTNAAGIKVSSAVSAQQLAAAVSAAQRLIRLPSTLTSGLTNPDYAVPGKVAKFDCQSVSNPSGAGVFGQCAYGDKAARKVMAVYGDSRESMWESSLEPIAARTGWQLRAYGLEGCPVIDLHFLNYATGTPFAACDTFHETAAQAIIALHPAILFMASISSRTLATKKGASPAQWQAAWIRTIKSFQADGIKVVVIGDVPYWSNDNADCLATHTSNVQACAVKRASGIPFPNYLHAEQAAAAETDATYVTTTGWVCGARCEPVIGGVRVYADTHHWTQGFSQYVSGALEEAVRSLVGPEQ